LSDEGNSPVENLGQVVFGERIRPSPYKVKCCFIKLSYFTTLINDFFIDSVVQNLMFLILAYFFTDQVFGATKMYSSLYQKLHWWRSGILEKSTALKKRHEPELSAPLDSW
jgi:hypothetical protein